MRRRKARRAAGADANRPQSRHAGARIAFQVEAEPREAERAGHSVSRPPVWLLLFAGLVLGGVIGGAIGAQFVAPAIGFFGSANLGPFFKGIVAGAVVGLTVAAFASRIVARSRR